MFKSKFLAAFLWAALLIGTVAGIAGTVTDPYTATSGATILSSELNSRFSTLYALVNGNIDNANIKTAAAINPTKLDLTKEFPVLRSTGTDKSFSSGTAGDTVPRWYVRADGKHLFGAGGASAVDTMLKRVSAGVLAVRDAADAADGNLTAGDLQSTTTTGLVMRPGCRLTLTTATPVTTSDVTAAATLYITPYISNVMPAYASSTTKYTNRTFSEFSVSLAGIASGTNYDVFARYSSGWAGSLVAWTNDTTRATGLTRSSTSGLYYKAGDEEYLYLGTIRGSGSGTTEDSVAKRYVFNAFNRVLRSMVAKDTTDTWTYTTATYQEQRAQSTEGVSRVGFVRGLSEDAIWAQATGSASNSGTAVLIATAIGLDAGTLATDCQPGAHLLNVANGRAQSIARYEGYPAVGYHTLRQLEYSTATGTTTWRGDNGADIEQSSLIAHTMM